MLNSNEDGDPLSIIKQVPQIVEDPIVVMKSLTRDDSIVLFGDVKADNGQSIMAALELTPMAGGNMEAEFSLITSAYGRTDDNIRNLLRNSEILYIDPDKNRADTWLMQLRVQFPSGQPSYGSIGNISYADDGVKITGKKLSELGGVIGSEEMPLPRNQKFASADSWEAGENANAERESQEKWESRFEPEELPYAEKMRQAKEVNRGQYATMADYERAVEERAEACKALGAALV